MRRPYSVFVGLLVLLFLILCAVDRDAVARGGSQEVSGDDFALLDLDGLVPEQLDELLDVNTLPPGVTATKVRQCFGTSACPSGGVCRGGLCR